MKITSINSGDIYGLWTIIKEDDLYRSPNGITARKALCRCECGTEKSVFIKHLISGRSTNCTCKGKKSTSIRSTTHGSSKTKLYKVWGDMRKRCNNPNHKFFSRYGGRGIKICSEWNDFEQFRKDMGENPSGLTLDRIDNDGDYTPDNCRWATMNEQSRNKSNTVYLTHKEETMPLTAWSDVTGIAPNTLKKRLKSGWDSATALHKPVRQSSRWHKNLSPTAPW